MGLQSWLRTSVGAVALCLAASSATAQQRPQLEVIHALTGSNAAPALKLLIDTVEAACNCSWKDNAIAGGSKARQTMANRAIGGDPAAVNQVHSPLVFKELSDAGLLVPVAPTGWSDVKTHVPEALWAMMVDEDDTGLLWAPTTMNLHNVGIFNKNALNTVGMKTPETIDEVFAFLDEVKARTDMVPLAWSEVPALMFQGLHNITAAVAGRDIYNRIYVDADPSAFDTAEFRSAAQAFKRLKAYTDEGRVGRVHQDAATMVVQGKAAMQYLGTHVLNVYVSAGAVAGETYECSTIGQTALLGPNGFMFGKPKDAVVGKAQAVFATAAMDPTFQARFAELTGGAPVRVDADVSKLNKCTRDANVPAAARNVLDPALTMSQDMQGQMTDAIVEFWSNDSMTVDQFVEKLQSSVAG